MIRRLLVAGLGFALAACSTQVASESSASETLANNAKHPVSGLDVVIVKITSGTHTHGFRAELAVSPEDQVRGLMFRTELGDDEGMLFPSNPPGIRRFWMKNTPLSLDIVFIGMDGRILNIADHTVPYSLTSIMSDGVASAVLELKAGRCAELGIAPGDKVEWAAP